MKEPEKIIYSKCCTRGDLSWINTRFDITKDSGVLEYMCLHCKNLYEVQQRVTNKGIVPISQWPLSGELFAELLEEEKVQRKYRNPDCGNDCMDLEKIAATISATGNGTGKRVDLFECRDCGTYYFFHMPFGARTIDARFGERYWSYPQRKNIVKAVSKMKVYVNYAALAQLE